VPKQSFRASISQPALAQVIEVGHGLEVEAGGEGAALSSDHRGTHRGFGTEAFEYAGQLLEQARVHGVHRWIGQRDNGNAVAVEGKVEAVHGIGLRRFRQ